MLHLWVESRESQLLLLWREDVLLRPVSKSVIILWQFSVLWSWVFICYWFVVCNFDFLTSISLTAVYTERSFDTSTLLSLIIVWLIYEKYYPNKEIWVENILKHCRTIGALTRKGYIKVAIIIDTNTPLFFLVMFALLPRQYHGPVN
jgi:hypothetical protein